MKHNNIFLFFIDNMFQPVQHHQVILQNVEQGVHCANTIHLIRDPLRVTNVLK